MKVKTIITIVTFVAGIGIVIATHKTALSMLGYLIIGIGILSSGGNNYPKKKRYFHYWISKEKTK